MIIEKCPKCGSSSLEHLCITTIPPINKVRCPICNWEHEEKEPVVNLPYGGSINIGGDMEVPIKPIEETDDKAIINYFSQKEWLILEQGLNAIFNQGNIDIDLSDFISLAIKVINLRKKKQKIDKEKKVIYHGFTVNSNNLDHYITTTTIETKPENIKATINNINEEEKEMENPCKECIKKLHKTDCAGCRDYADYMVYFQKLIDKKIEREKKAGIDDNKKSKYRCPCNGCEKEPKDCICEDFYRFIGKRKPNNPED